MKKYGHFDAENREYVITNPRTPFPWMNYIYNDEYYALLSHTGGGYSFHISARDKRLLRYRLNNVPMDRPGRYVYIQDRRDSDYWSAGWAPVCKPLARQKFESRHGMGYSRLLSNYRDISSELTYLVPRADNLELWWLRLENKGRSKRRLRLYNYAEWCLWGAENDMHNFQWTYNIGNAYYREGIIHHETMKGSGNYAFLGTSRRPSSHDCDREHFIGPNNCEADPRALERGECFKSIGNGGNPVAVLQHDVELAAGKSLDLVYVLGTGANAAEGKRLVKKYSSAAMAKKVLAEVRERWAARIGRLQVETPDPEAALVLNQWHPYQAYTTFEVSRGPSIYEGGIGRGMGFRDSSQDILGVTHNAKPERVEKLMRELAGIQFSRGDAMHQFFRSIGGGPATGDGRGYSDDQLWLIIAVTQYLKETGNFAFLKEKIKWADGGEAPLLTHLQKAVDFSYKTVGSKGIPLSGLADWNDCLNLKGPRNDGQTVMVAHQLCYVSGLLADLYEHLGDKARAATLRKKSAKMARQVNKVAWDGAWYVRAWQDNGQVMGSKRSPKGKIFLNAQTWAVMAGVADVKRARQVMDSARKHLGTKYGLMLLQPCYEGLDGNIGGMTTFVKNVKENGGIFCHTNPWAVIAETKLGRGDRAYEYYRNITPAVFQNMQDLHVAEPYVHCQSICGAGRHDFGRGRNSWLTGTAAWNYVAATQYIFGLRPEYAGLRIDPCLPAKWQGFSARRVFRGCTYDIRVKKATGICRGVAEISVDGRRIEGNVLPVFEDGRVHRVEVDIRKV